MKNGQNCTFRVKREELFCNLPSLMWKGNFFFKFPIPHVSREEIVFPFSFPTVTLFLRSIKKKILKILKNMKTYRNTFVFIFFAFLTIDACEIENAKNRHLCATRAEFTSNSNEHRFLIYVDD